MYTKKINDLFLHLFKSNLRMLIWQKILDEFEVFDLNSDNGDDDDELMMMTMMTMTNM